MIENQSLDFKIGELTGQIAALIDSNRTLADSFSRLEMRFENAIKNVETRLNQDIETINRRTADIIKDTTDLKVKVAVYGATGGILVNVAFLIVEHFLLK